MELFQTQKKYQAVGLLCELEGGATKEQIIQMLALLPDDEELVPFNVSENNSAVVGFMTAQAAGDHQEEAEALLINLCEDWSNERGDKTYVTISGLVIYVDCEVETTNGVIV